MKIGNQEKPVFLEFWGYLPKKPFVLKRMAFKIVESEGFEPSSKQRIFKASTCLVFD